MKKLVLINHQGEVKHTFDVYLEGADFEHEFPAPVAVWLGTVAILDPDALSVLLAAGVKKQGVLGVTPEVKQAVGGLESEGVILLPEQAASLEATDSGEEMARPVKCSCGWTGTLADCGFGHNDYYCPKCGSESIEERIDEQPEATVDTSAGDGGAGETVEPPSTEATSQESTEGEASGGSEGVRDFKTTQDSVGGGSE